jgi:eukaryotic-like serine/threonine-protein kinase
MLFGLLAFQVGLIDQAQLIAAFQRWARDRDRPLAEHLTVRGDLDAEQLAAVDQMVALHLTKHADDTEQSLAAIPALRSTIANASRVADGTIDALLTHPGVESTLGVDGPDRGELSAAGPIAAHSQRYRVLRLHARGALGAVFVALDSELHREVAIKEILDHHADNAASRSRFLLEAEVTGGLEHPGIVPVYGLGNHAGGRPYYAMRLIHGGSLQEAIDQFRADAALKGEPGRRSLELRKLLRRFTDVCNAIDYAHNRGVIHRDIKPSNIVVGKYGETLVVDWGLAKPIGQIEPDSPSGERPLVFSASGASTGTLPGSAMGTPAYMSPEQAAGDLDRLGPCSDVYSLGATLYCVLTGKPPFEGSDLAAILGAVQKGAFSPPRKLDPSIDRGLEAVCLKAMALKPEGRYETARALADDLEHWLADEPVKAHPERRSERLARRLRQNRAWTYAAVVALVGISMAATIGIVVVDRARRREAEVRKEAEANFLMAQRAVDDYLTSVSENTLLKQQESVDIRSLRYELLNNALDYYKSFVSQRRDDPSLRRQLANAYYRVGEIKREIGSLPEAIGAFQSARALWEPLADAQPREHALRGRLADCDLAIGGLQTSTDDIQAAVRSLTRAQAALEPLAKAYPDVGSYQERLAGCYLRMGIILQEFPSSEQAAEMLARAKTIEEGLITQFPARPADQRILAEIILATGTLSWTKHDYPGALRSFQETQRICRSVLDQVTVGPKPVRLLDLLAISHYNIAAIHREMGALEDALMSFAKSLDYRSALMDAHPSVTQFQQQLGKNLAEIAVLQHDAHHDVDASASIKRSIAILERLVGAHADQARYHHDLGRSWNIQGYFLDEARQNRPAIPAFERAVAEHLLAITQAPDVNLYKVELCSDLDNLGEQYVDLGKVAEALPVYRRQIAMWRELLANRPGDRKYSLELAKTLSHVGDIERHAGDSKAALELYADARSILEPGAAAAPADGVFQIRVGMALAREASALADLGDPGNARGLLERAVRTLSDASVSSAEETPRRESQSAALWEFARVLRVLNESREADRVDTQRVAIWRDRPAPELAALALKQTKLATLIGYGKTSVPPSGLAVRELDLDQAAANLQLAMAQGFRDLRVLQSDPDSSFLLSREDVKPLVQDMVFPARPFAE